MLVEDDGIVVRVLARMLSEDGFDVEFALDGAAAIARLARAPAFDALVVDFRIPYADGFAVASYARSRYPSIHVVMVTSYPELTGQFDPPFNPPIVVLPKPLAYRELARELEQFRQARPITSNALP